MVAVDTKSAFKFLRMIDPKARSFTFQTFPEKGDTKSKAFAQIIHADTITDLRREHDLGAGIYLAINETDGRGRGVDHTVRVRATWQEDDGGFDGAFPLTPSIIIESSPGHFHRYWLVADDWPADDKGRADFAAVIERMIESYASDKNAKDISRVLRIPGFLHRKADKGPVTPFMVRIVEANGKRYTRAQIIAAFPPVEKKPEPQRTWQPPGDDDERIRDALNAVNADERDIWLQIGMALKDEMGDAGRSLWDAWASRSEKFKERDQDKTWRSLRRQGITIATLFHHAKQGGWEPKKRSIKGDDDDKIIELAKLNPLKYGKIRKQEAKRLGVGVKVLDDAVREQQKEKKEQASFLPHWNNEPAPDPVAGSALLDELRAHLKRHVVLPPHADVALALWVLHTWVFDAFDITPYLAITSPTRRCGKSLLMTLLYWLCCRGKKNDSMSKAAIYRSVEAERPTLILDEVGWVVDLKDERQGILCGGFERLGYVEVCEGEGADITVRRYSTYCPKAFGLIGKLTATLMDRSIEIPMRRKLAERVERLRRRDNDEHARLRRLCCRWAQDNVEALAKAAPALPDKLNDRAVDFWEPLLAIAALAGGEWVKLATETAVALSDGDGATEERGVELLRDTKAEFDKRGQPAITTKTLIAALCGDEERPWATYSRGQHITDRQLAKLFKPFSIISETVQTSETGEPQAKGYRRAHFDDAFERYLPAENNVSPQSGGSQASKRTNADETATSDAFCVRPETSLDGCEKREKPANDGGSDAWTDKKAEPPREKLFSGNGAGGEPPGRMAVNGFAISATPEDRKPPEPGQLTCRVWIKEGRPVPLGPPGDDMNDFTIS